MTAQEEPFCQLKRGYLFLNIRTILQKILSFPRLSLENISNAITVTIDCWKGKSDSWLIDADFQYAPVATIIPMSKRKPSKQTAKLMEEYYQDSADDDLALAKEFEGIESEIDMDSS